MLNWISTTMKRILTTLKALADETRLKLVHLLLDQDLCGKALAQHLGISEAAVSQHLKVLKEASVVEGEKRGYWTHYAIKKDTLDVVIGELQRIARQTALSDRSCYRMRVGNRKYSGKEVKTMCQSCCEHPEKLKGKPGECTPEQIRECHGNEKDHTCKGEKKEEN
jgi:DNA-binding transcriptional ArsR family regulator